MYVIYSEILKAKSLDLRYYPEPCSFKCNRSKVNERNTNFETVLILKKFRFCFCFFDKNWTESQVAPPYKSLTYLKDKELDFLKV